jgi:hypothetical protein
VTHESNKRLKLAFAYLDSCFNRFFAKNRGSCGGILSPAVDIGYTRQITAKDGEND